VLCPIYTQSPVGKEVNARHLHEVDVHLVPLSFSERQHLGTLASSLVGNVQMLGNTGGGIAKAAVEVTVEADNATIFTDNFSDLSSHVNVVVHRLIDAAVELDVDTIPLIFRECVELSTDCDVEALWNTRGGVAKAGVEVLREAKGAHVVVGDLKDLLCHIAVVVHGIEATSTVGNLEVDLVPLTLVERLGHAIEVHGQLLGNARGGIAKNGIEVPIEA